MKMAGMNLNFGFSVFKREAKDMANVERHLSRDGWEKTGEVGERVAYYEKSGINVTVIGGPRGTVIMPSGPIRGTVFGKNNKLFSDTSVIGAGKDTSNDSEESQIRGSRRSNNPMA